MFGNPLVRISAVHKPFNRTVHFTPAGRLAKAADAHQHLVSTRASRIEHGDIAHLPSVYWFAALGLHPRGGHHSPCVILQRRESAALSPVGTGVFTGFEEAKERFVSHQAGINHATLNHVLALLAIKPKHMV